MRNLAGAKAEQQSKKDSLSFAGPEKLNDFFDGVCGHFEGKPVMYKSMPIGTLLSIEGVGMVELHNAYFDVASNKFKSIGM